MSAKVCILTSAYPVFDGKIFHRHAKSLAKAGYEVTLIAQHTSDETVDGVKIIALPKHKNRFQRMTSTTLRTFLLALKQRAAIYHLHNPELLPMGMLLKLLTRGKIISDVHEDYPKHILLKEWIPSYLRRVLSFVTEKIEALSAKYFDAITTPTDPLTQRFQRGKRTMTLYNFPLFDLFESFEPEADPEFDIIHIGSILQPRLSFMLKVGVELRRMGYKFKWCVLGSPPELTAWVESRLNQYGLKENFIFLSEVPHTEVVRYLNRSRMGINHHPPQERFLVAIPIKLFEYMACGLPVVSSDLPLIRRFVEGRDCAMLVKPNDVEGFAHAIGFLLNHPEKARQMGDHGRELVKREYNWSQEEKKLFALYHGLLAG